MTATRRTAAPRESSAPPKAGRVAADVDPVARLMVDVPLPHLDRPFDYLVPTTLDADVTAGSRVRVRFAGRLVDAYVLERRAASEHDGKLAFLERAVGTTPVLSAETAELFRAVADRWAGNFVDVVRLGVPARHASAEKAAVPEQAGESAAGTLPADTAAEHFAPYRAGSAFVNAVTAGRAARAVWAAALAAAAAAAVRGGRGALVVVPDARDLARLDLAMSVVLGPDRHVALSADLGPAERYRRWLRVRRGEITVAIGTRAAAYAPVERLGLVAIWDDGDDLHVDPRAPYPHSRDVLSLRSAQTGAAMLIGSFARSVEAAQLLRSGWAHEIVADRATLRGAAPRVRAVADDVEIARDPAAAAARLPSLAWRTTRDALAAGRPVLVQVPRRGYAPSLACARDRTPARCPHCAGPLAATRSGAVPTCRWCGRPATQWRCPVCNGTALRAVVVGAARTAEELGRAFAGVPVRTSGGDRVLAEIAADAAVVVATPGAEPFVADGYGAALLLDGWALLSRPDLRAAEETLRRWANAAALVRPGGTVVVGADAQVPAVQALVRWDPGGFAERELADRAELGFPPSTRMAALTGAAAALHELLGAAELPESTRIVGPVPVDEQTERLLVRVARADGNTLARALHVAAAGRSSRRSAQPVRIDLDPAELG